MTENAIIRLKDGVDMDDHIRKQNEQHGSVAHKVIYKWPVKLSNAYAGEFAPKVLKHLKSHDNVNYISDNGPTKTFAIVQQPNAGWSLARIQRAEAIQGAWDAFNHTYQYDDANGIGAGVDIHIIDTGIYVQHTDFGGVGGRATYAGGNANNNDLDGHGTQVAGVAGGTRWGVAKGANLIAVKVQPGADGITLVMHDVQAIDWVLENAPPTAERPSIVNISRGCPFNQFYNERVADLIEKQIHVVVAAGNENQDANLTSPASAPFVNTVGATDIQDRRYRVEEEDGIISSSNYGSCVDFFAPGKDIASCGHTGPNAVVASYGTSLAAPVVAGIIATIISSQGNLLPAQMTELIKGQCLEGVINMAGIPNPGQTANRLVHRVPPE